ncbi:MAG: dicarboxylate/amino acid:cation symporter [Chitinophagaceae bacterium]|mgnify:FL=1|nr:dicarboxylate/amino acid:cation symporter [Chitinophagaceae bacterium]MBK8787589.1 dicarboxylate/amino acid:cation symporter [Chitinophagaceae bacterium]MBL0201866.1 dicarboxylate/amino acid:cation symporter [Chitinophagaceae bacterium]
MEIAHQPTKKSRLTLYILIAMILGIVAGYIVHENYEAATIKTFSDNAKLLTTIFLRMVQMIIAPIVFATLVVGIAKLGDMKTVGRVGGKAMLWFITASLISLGLGLILVNIFKPGVGVDITNTDMAAVNDLLEKSKGFSLQKFVEHVVPRSVVEAMATNEILQLVVFSVFFGVALTAIGKKGEPIVNALDSLAHVVLKMVTYVMYLAPLGVFGAMAAAIAKNGLGILVTFGYYVGEFYLGLAILWLLLLFVGYLFLKHRLRVLLRRIAAPMSIAFSTASSEAVYPKLVEEMERFGCNNKIVSFVLPLGYSFNLDGSMMYMTFASMFIAQAFNITSITGDVSQQIIMLLVFLVTSKGIAGVPRASLVVVLATGAMFGLPPEGVGLILAIDVFCDMGRTMTNVLGNALATAAVSKWEGQLENP